MSEARVAVPVYAIYYCYGCSHSNAASPSSAKVICLDYYQQYCMLMLPYTFTHPFRAHVCARGAYQVFKAMRRTAQHAWHGILWQHRNVREHRLRTYTIYIFIAQGPGRLMRFGGPNHHQCTVKRSLKKCSTPLSLRQTSFVAQVVFVYTKKYIRQASVSVKYC